MEDIPKEEVVLVLLVLALLCIPAFGQTIAVDWKNKGFALDAQEKYAEAVQAYNKAIEIDPQDELVRNRVNTLEEGGHLGLRTAFDWIAEGGALGSQGKWDGAIQAYDKAIQIDPQNEIAWTSKVNALKTIGRYEEANAADAKIKELEAAGTTTILDHSMARDIDNSTNSAIGRTYNFSVDGSKAYSWLSLGNVRPNAVWWYWYSPAGNQLHEGRVDIPTPTSGAYWSTYNVSDHIDIAGNYAANLSGDWHVDVYLKGSKILREDFSIEYQQPNGPNGQPSQGQEGQPPIAPGNQSLTPAFG
jgi:tetratricopeptide (TPR) repeat protein